MRAWLSSNVTVNGQHNKQAGTASSSDANGQQLQQHHQNSSTQNTQLLAHNFQVLKRIKADLVEADVNRDGRIDFEELKLILSKYSANGQIFTPQQVEDIGELFYVGRSGQSVSHTTFLRGIQHVMAQTQTAAADSSSSTATSSSDKSNASTQNPLHLTSVDDKSCWIHPPRNDKQSQQQLFYNVQAQFEESLLAYVEQVNLLQQLGGPQQLERATNMLYEKAFHDDRIRPFFLFAANQHNTKPLSDDDHDSDDDKALFLEQLKRHQYNFMKVAFSRPIPERHAFSKQMRKAHAKLFSEMGLNETHFDIMLQHFVDTLQELHHELDMDDGNTAKVSTNRRVSQDTIDTAVEVVCLFRDSFVQSKHEKEEETGE